MTTALSANAPRYLLAGGRELMSLSSPGPDSLYLYRALAPRLGGNYPTLLAWARLRPYDVLSRDQSPTAAANGKLSAG